ncbi:MAG: undecaprenyl-diphosphate phosphatase, partial [Candidatus Hodarchaeales archaeon]
MTDIITAILMAFFQGIIEWLPISSEGQLSLLFVTIYDMDQVTAVTLALLLHLGTMIAVIWYFRDYLKEILDPQSKILQIMILSTLGTAITAVPLVLLFKSSWVIITENLILPADFIFTSLIGISLIITGLVLSKQPEQGSRELPSLSSNEAFLLGLFQGIAALPGISRSGMTITYLLIIGLTHRDALKTSFLVSIPAVLGATGLEFLLSGFTLGIAGITVGEVFFSYPILLFSILLTALIGYLTIDSLIKLKKIPYDKFCIGFGVLTIILG